MTSKRLPVAAITLHFLKAIGLPLAGLLLASCANDPAQSANAGEECVYVRVTGSNMPVKECSTAEEREAIAASNREAAEQGLRDLQTLGEFGVEAPGAASLD